MSSTAWKLIMFGALLSLPSLAAYKATCTQYDSKGNVTRTGGCLVSEGGKFISWLSVFKVPPRTRIEVVPGTKLTEAQLEHEAVTGEASTKRDNTEQK